MTIATAFPVNPVVCQSTLDATGLLRLTLTVASNDTVTGTGDTSFLSTPVSQSGCPVQQIASTVSFSDAVSGTRGAFTLTARSSYNGPSHYGPIAGASTLTFSGSLANGVITGTLVFSNSGSGTSDGSNGGTAGAPITISGTVAMPVMLR